MEVIVMHTTYDRNALQQRIRKILDSPRSREARLQAICEELKTAGPHYDWVGFYLVDSEVEGELVLGPYAGEPTEHVRIKFGQGICGQAASTRETFVIQDVTQETNYLSCSPDVKSEIVLPIFNEDELVGELDIDSHDLAPFSEADRRLLDRICRWIAPYID
jgi:GAF domain-containing protein